MKEDEDEQKKQQEVRSGKRTDVLKNANNITAKSFKELTFCPYINHRISTFVSIPRPKPKFYRTEHYGGPRKMKSPLGPSIIES